MIDLLPTELIGEILKYLYFDDILDLMNTNNSLKLKILANWKSESFRREYQDGFFYDLILNKRYFQNIEVDHSHGIYVMEKALSYGFKILSFLEIYTPMHWRIDHKYKCKDWVRKEKAGSLFNIRNFDKEAAKLELKQHLNLDLAPKRLVIFVYCDDGFSRFQLENSLKKIGNPLGPKRRIIEANDHYQYLSCFDDNVQEDSDSDSGQETY